MSKEKLTPSALSDRLWEMSKALRGNLDGNEFKDYILGLLFYRFLSDKSIQTAKKCSQSRKIVHTQNCF